LSTDAITMAATGSGSNKRHAAAPVDDVPLLVRVLGGNPVTSLCVLSCLDTFDVVALRQLHPAVAGAVAQVPWVDTDTIVMDAIRWRAALPGAVGVRLVGSSLLSVPEVAALAGVTCLSLSGCPKVTDELLLRLPTSLRTLNVRGCRNLTAGASFVHLTALVSLDCAESIVTLSHTRGLPPSLQELDVSTRYVTWRSLPAGISLAHLSQLRVLRAGWTYLDAVTLATMPPCLVELDMRCCTDFTAAASFAHLPALQTLHAARSNLYNDSLVRLPPSLVYLDVSRCINLTPVAALLPLPALRTLDVSDTRVGDALVASLPAGLTELRMTSCRSVTARATLDHVPTLKLLHSMGTAVAPTVVAACRARGCAVPAAGELRGHQSRVAAMAVLADGQLASGDYRSSGEVRLWNAAAGGGVTAVFEVGGRVLAMAALPGGRCLAVAVSCSRGGFVALRDVATPVWVARIPCDSAVSALAVLADGRLAAGCDDGRVLVVDAAARVVAAVLEGHSTSVKALAVLPDGTLTSGSADGTVRLWDVSTQACVAKLSGHTDGVGPLAVLVDGRLACGAFNGMVGLWDVESRTCVATLIGRGDPVAALAALPDGRLVSGSNGGFIQLWDTRPAAAAAMVATSRAASTVAMTVLAEVPGGTPLLALLRDGRLACACAADVFLLEVPPPATYE